MASASGCSIRTSTSAAPCAAVRAGCGDSPQSNEEWNDAAGDERIGLGQLPRQRHSIGSLTRAELHLTQRNPVFHGSRAKRVEVTALRGPRRQSWFVDRIYTEPSA